MPFCFYDNIEISDESIVSIDRVYGLDFGQFDDEMWDKLSEIYSMLPAQIKVDGVGQPAWFGEEDKHHEYLWASVEPSGGAGCRTIEFRRLVRVGKDVS